MSMHDGTCSSAGSVADAFGLWLIAASSRLSARCEEPRLAQGVDQLLRCVDETCIFGCDRHASSLRAVVSSVRSRGECRRAKFCIDRYSSSQATRCRMARDSGRANGMSVCAACDAPSKSSEPSSSKNVSKDAAKSASAILRASARALLVLIVNRPRLAHPHTGSSKDGRRGFRCVLRDIL